MVKYAVELPYKAGPVKQLFDTEWGAMIAARLTGGEYLGPTELPIGILIEKSKRKKSSKFGEVHHKGPIINGIKYNLDGTVDKRAKRRKDNAA